MAVVILSLTDSDEVRSALGVTSRDVSDTFITSRNVDRELRIALNEWLPDYATRLATWNADTATYQTELDLLKSYAMYMSAYILSSGLEFLVVREISDSKMTAARFSNTKLDEIRTSMYSKASKFRRMLEEKLGLPTNGTPSIFSSVSPSYDPVLGG